MRYYDITLSKKGKVLREWTSHPNGKSDPGALNIEFDIMAYNYATPMGAQSLTIWGISLQDLTQANNYASGDVILTLKGGMQAGLPLNNPAQAGILTIGTVFQAFGNWQETDMTMDLVIIPSSYTNASPGNIVLDWKAGTPLSIALSQTFSTAWPTMKQDISISDNYVLDHDETGYYSTLQTLSQSLYEMTNGLIGNDWVSVTINQGVLKAYDQAIRQTPVILAFTDMVGQPTWISNDVMQVKVVMRADIMVGSSIEMPKGLQGTPGIVLTNAASSPAFYKYKSLFQGQFYVQSMRHVGNFRSSDGSAWITIMNCVPLGNPDG